MHAKIQGILFDLDGTLLDTAGDLAATLNKVLASQQIKPLHFDTIRPAISTGISGLLALGLNIKEQDPAFPSLRQQFINYYKQHICVYTHLFPGIETLINYLQENKWPWGIVTNKSSALTIDLVKQFPSLNSAKCIIAGDTLKHSKPHPQPLLHACQYLCDWSSDVCSSDLLAMPNATLKRLMRRACIALSPIMVISTLKKMLRLGTPVLLSLLRSILLSA